MYTCVVIRRGHGVRIRAAEDLLSDSVVRLIVLLDRDQKLFELYRTMKGFVRCGRNNGTLVHTNFVA